MDLGGGGGAFESEADADHLGGYYQQRLVVV